MQKHEFNWKLCATCLIVVAAAFSSKMLFGDLAGSVLFPRFWVFDGFMEVLY